MVLVQTFGFGLLTREILMRRAGNQARELGHRITSTRELKSSYPKRNLNLRKKVDPYSAEEIRARLGGSGTRHSYRLLSTNASNDDSLKINDDETW